MTRETKDTIALLAAVALVLALWCAAWQAGFRFVIVAELDRREAQAEERAQASRERLEKLEELVRAKNQRCERALDSIDAFMRSMSQVRR